MTAALTPAQQHALEKATAASIAAAARRRDDRRRELERALADRKAEFDRLATEWLELHDLASDEALSLQRRALFEARAARSIERKLAE